MSELSRGQASVSIPADAIITASEDNNNQSHEPEENERQIGVAPEGYNIHESVLYTHGYFEKIKKDDGSTVAKCLMCWKKSKETVVTRKITDSSTKGLINHIQTHHKQYVKKWEEQKDANDKLRASYNPIRKKNKKTDDGTKQQTLFGGNQGILQVESRHDAGAQKRFDEARVMFCAMTMTPFNALQHDHLYVKALCPKSHHRIQIKTPQTISSHTRKKAVELRKTILSLILTAKKNNQSFSFSSDMYRSRNNSSVISLTVHFKTPDNKMFKLTAYAEYFGPRRHTGANIEFSLRAFMTELGLDGPEIRRYIILDNAANNVKAMRLGTDLFEVIWCVIHTLQLAIKDALKVRLSLHQSAFLNDSCFSGEAWSDFCGKGLG